MLKALATAAPAHVLEALAAAALAHWLLHAAAARCAESEDVAALLEDLQEKVQELQVRTVVGVVRHRPGRWHLLSCDAPRRCVPRWRGLQAERARLQHASQAHHSLPARAALQDLIAQNTDTKNMLKVSWHSAS